MKMKRIIAIVLSAMMLCLLAAGTLAADAPSITVTNGNAAVSMAGHTYTAYKVLDLSYNGASAYSYTIANGFSAFFAVENNGADMTDVQAWNHILAQTDMQAFAAKLLAYIKNGSAAAAYSVTSAAATAETITIEPASLGYYLVVDNGASGQTSEKQSVVAALALTSTDYTAQISLKADAPSIEKKIVQDQTKSDTATAAIGDVQHYEVTTAVPDMTGYTKYYFIITDTMTEGLTFNNDIVVTLGSNTLVKDEDYIVNADGGTFTIVFIDFVQYADSEDAVITATYSATVNEKAAVGNAGNKNEVTLTYSNDPTFGGQGEGDIPGGDDPVGITPKDTVLTFTTGISLEKINKNREILTGAKFEINGIKVNKILVVREDFVKSEDGEYVLLEDGTYYKVTAEDGNIYDDKDKYTLTAVNELIATSETVKASAYVGADGKLSFNGLAEGNYVITELVSPAGYNMLAAPINIHIICTAPSSVIDGTEECVWTYWTDGAVVSGNAENALVSNGVICLSVVNSSGSELPETGGIGTVFFTVSGVLLMAGAAVAFLLRRKFSGKSK